MEAIYDITKLAIGDKVYISEPKYVLLIEHIDVESSRYRGRWLHNPNIIGTDDSLSSWVSLFDYSVVILQKKTKIVRNLPEWF